jgi:ATPase subunit of ABC transporter with duplicated ATPase domains
MSAFVTLDGLSYRTPDGRSLFDDLTLAFGAERSGLVGCNGVGKTTLLRLMLGELTPSQGSVAVRGRVGVLRQALAPPPQAVVADLLGAAEGIARLARVVAGRGSDGDFAEADWTLDAKLQAALAAVGLGGLAFDRSAQTLSGGEATRAALAGLLAAEPDLLILDEPTNNLDAEARELVGQVLERWRGGAIVISHDRGLLRRMDRIVELSSLGARVYGGGYDLYAGRKAEEAAAASRGLEVAEQTAAQVERDVQAAREKQARRDAAGRRSRARGDAPKILLDAQAERAERTGGRGARLAERLRDAVQAELGAAQARVEQGRGLAFDLPSSALPAGKTVLALDGVSFAYPDAAPLVSDLSLRMTGPERIALAGGNGAGKSTLIRLIAGDLAPTAGRIVVNGPVAVLDQRAALLHEDETLLQAFLRLNPGGGANAAYAALARFLFRNTAALRLVRELSGGERLRAALACVLMADRPPQLLILDEPTNHLDLESVTAVEAALGDYDGAILAVSHDADFLAAIGVARTVRLAPP